MKKENSSLDGERDCDEKIIESRTCVFNGIKCILEKWELDGITGNSASYLVADVSHFTKDELIQFSFKHLEIVADSKYFFSSTRTLITIRFVCT